MTADRTRAPRVLLGVTGGIAAYKSLELVRLFARAGWDVTVAMTAAARRFVGPESFRALSGNPVALELFPRKRPAARKSSIDHVDLATSADLVVVAPATANVIGKLASGIADDLLSTLLLAIPAATIAARRALFAPAMNTNMWLNASVRENIRRLDEQGYGFVEPGVGELACGTSGPGRMAEPAVIFERCRLALGSSSGRQTPNLKSARVLVTTGRTEEPLDPVRVITNRSSGLMGIEIARAFATTGASVRLVAGAVSVPLPSGVQVEQALTTEAMLRAVLRHLPETDVLVMCAAVADYRPVRPSRAKRHGESLVLELERTPDILRAVSKVKHHALVIGFSLDDSQARARAKLKEKRLDLAVANPFATVGADTIAARLLFRSGRSRPLKPMPKADFARVLVAEVDRALARKGTK